jgi:hypothetical protein
MTLLPPKNRKRVAIMFAILPYCIFAFSSSATSPGIEISSTQPPKFRHRLPP